ncbi:hypothetical protein Tco_0337703 [Tanacetum coccineum]
MMGGIDISTLTLEQYFRMIDENHAPGIVNKEFGRTMEKDIEDMAIAEYMKYEAEMKRQSWRDSQSYFPTKYDNWDVGSFHLEENKTSDYPYYTNDAKIDAYYDLPPLLPCFKPIQPYTKRKNESYKTELDEEINYMSDGESVMSEQGTIDNTDAPNLEPYDEGMCNDDDVDECNDTVEEDSRPSRTLTCQFQPKELSPGSFSLPCTIEWLKVKIGHTSVANFDREKVFNEWVLDSFDIEADYAKMFANPYSRRFDEYKRIFINEVEQLSNEYELKIGENRIKKAEYVSPIVNIETFEVKRYSFTGGRSFICITKQFDDALPLGRANWSQFSRMTRKELVPDKSTKGAT